MSSSGMFYTLSAAIIGVMIIVAGFVLKSDPVLQGVEVHSSQADTVKQFAAFIDQRPELAQNQAYSPQQVDKVDRAAEENKISYFRNKFKSDSISINLTQKNLKWTESIQELIKVAADSSLDVLTREELLELLSSELIAARADQDGVTQYYADEALQEYLRIEKRENRAEAVVSAYREKVIQMSIEKAAEQK